MTEANPLLFRNQHRQVEFDLVRIGLFRKSQALRKAHDVGIDADSLLAKGVTKNNVGGFPADARETQEIVQVIGHLSTKTLNQLIAAVVDRARFVAVKVDPTKFFLQLLNGRSSVVFGGSIFLKEIDGDLIHKVVPRLRRQDQSNEQFKRIAEVEVEFGVGVDLLEPSDDLFNPVFFTRCY